MRLFNGIYRGRKVLVTGHTGFKGSWLALWLTALGADVFGLALSPVTSPNHWELLELPITERRVDVRDGQAVTDFVKQIEPEIVFHLAAQPLVMRSYRDPLETWSTNVMGTANLLEACRRAGVRAVVVATTDKVYHCDESQRGYRETDRLGGHDPYSASKAAAELVVASYRKSFCPDGDAPLLASARAGNVIGGGDWSEDRLVPDMVRAMQAGLSLEIRAPGSTRPWQHVLECLSGYLLLGQKLLAGRRDFADAWNFGPEPGSNITVAEVLSGIRSCWSDLRWHASEQLQPHESGALLLDSSKARELLGWEPVWTMAESLAATADWYQRFLTDGQVFSRQQLDAYLVAGVRAQRAWART